MNSAAFSQCADGSITISDKQTFSHQHHIELAYHLLDKHDFFVASNLFAQAIRELVERLGAQDKFHSTITLAFMAVISECMRREDYSDFTRFLESNPQLLDKKLLQKWYPNDQLKSTIAKSTFVLPRAS